MIVKAAVKIYDARQDKEVVIPCHRHADVYELLYNLGYQTNVDYQPIQEGFLDEHDIFLDRHHAWLDAVHDKQLMVIDPNCRRLYSEDLW